MNYRQPGSNAVDAPLPVIESIFRASRVTNIRAGLLLGLLLATLIPGARAQADTTIQRAAAGAVGHDEVTLFLNLEGGSGELFCNAFPVCPEVVVFEFDLSLVTPTPNASVVLNLPHVGNGFPEGTQWDMVWYEGDGIFDASDHSASGTFIENNVFPDGGSYHTQHDVTAAVNAAVAAGHDYIGIRMEPISGFEGFFCCGVFPTLTFSDQQLQAPVPALSPTGLLGLAALLGGSGWVLRSRVWRTT